jgi:hypothetical protein
MKLNISKCVFAFIILTSTFSYAQGCSDAGFCSVGNAFKEPGVSLKNNLEVGFGFGAADEDVTVFSQYITYTRNFSSTFAMSLKVTSAIANGGFGSNGNIGDAFLTGNYKLKPGSENKNWSVLLGVKIPFTQGDDKINSISLPMAYQSSLGTFDLIAGVSLNYKKWDFNTALQLPISGENKNAFFNGVFITGFPSTNLFKRQSDGLFRVTYTLKTKNDKFTFKPNLLFIYHFGEDSFENGLGKRQDIIGSDGVTLNGNLIANYKINSNSSLETSIATPFVVRDVRPDGLTREYTIGLSYKVNF